MKFTTTGNITRYFLFARHQFRTPISTWCLEVRIFYYILVYIEAVHLSEKIDLIRLDTSRKSSDDNFYIRD